MGSAPATYHQGDYLEGATVSLLFSPANRVQEPLVLDSLCQLQGNVSQLSLSPEPPMSLNHLSPKSGFLPFFGIPETCLKLSQGFR